MVNANNYLEKLERVRNLCVMRQEKKNVYINLMRKDQQLAGITRIEVNGYSMKYLLLLSSQVNRLKVIKQAITNTIQTI